MRYDWRFVTLGFLSVGLAILGSVKGWPIGLWGTPGLFGLGCLIQGIFRADRFTDDVALGPEWKRTDERFIDTSTGEMMEVRYNVKTGARKSVPYRDPGTGAI